MPDSLARGPFVGRAPELRRLLAAYDTAAAGNGVLALVTGEPGIGKTTLCARLATEVRERDALVLVGHSYEEGSLSLPYLPFVEALRAYVEDRGRELLRRELGRVAPEIARIVPEVRDRLDVEPEPSTDPDTDRYRLFQAVLAFVRGLTTTRPLLLILEDLHDADRGTLDLLLHLARNLDGLPVLLIVTYRDVEVDRTHPLAATLVALRRATAVERVRLGGLSPEETDALTQAVAGGEVSAGLVRAVHAQTEGNPLFVQETARWLVEEGRLGTGSGERGAGSGLGSPGDKQQAAIAGIPEGVREVIGRRLSRLTGDCNRTLSVASVIGQEFDLRTVVAVAGEDEDAVVAALEEAVEAGMLAEEERRGTVHYRFAHALFRQTLYEELRATRRIRLHRQVARALEAAHADSLPEHAAQLADHFAHSSDPADLGKAVSYGELAARRANAVYAYGEAARLLERALEVQEVLDPADRARACDLANALSVALLDSGQAPRVLDEVAPRAFKLAEALEDADRISQVCMHALQCFNRMFAGTVSPASYPVWIERLDQAARPGTIARVRADRALGNMHVASRRAEGIRLVTQALDLARRLDHASEQFVSANSWLVWADAPQHAAARLAVAREMLALPRAGLALSRIETGLLWSNHGLLAWGLRDEAVAVWDEALAIQERAEQPNLKLDALMVHAFLDTLNGNLEAAVAAAEHIMKRGSELGVAGYAPLPAGYAGMSALILLGRTDEMQRYRDLPSLHTLARAEQGEREAAVTLLDKHVVGRPHFGAAEDVTSVTDDMQYLQAALLIGHRRAAEMLLARFADDACVMPGTTYMTSIARHLGAAAAMLGRIDEARRWYAKALADMEAMRFRPEIALVRLQTAELLADHVPDELDEARAHLAAAMPELEAMGMQPALERAQRLRDRMEAPALPAVPAGAGGPTERVLATVLFTDIVGSTERAAVLGDRAWHDLKAQHHALVRVELARFGGREVDTAGDGFFCLFDAPARAIHCALAIGQAVRSLGLAVRAGVHTGEVELSETGVSGLAVHIGARVAGLAGPDDVLVSRTVRDLAAGSGLRFDDRGSHALKGLPEPWQLFVAVAPS